MLDLSAKLPEKVDLIGSLRVEGEGLEPAAHISRVLSIVRTHLNMDVGFVSEFSEGRRVFRHVDNGVETSPVRVGGSDPLEESYCKRIVDGRLPELMQDACAVPAALELEVTRQLPVGAHISVPLRLPDGKLFGTFCCFSFTADYSLNRRDLSILRAFAAVVSELIYAELELERRFEIKRDRVLTAIETAAFHVRYQPIFRMSDEAVAGFEALARFTPEPYRPPDEWFNEAADVGLGAELEIAAARQAMLALDALPEDVMLSVNFSPETILSAAFGELLHGAPLKRLVVEVTEHAAVANYGVLAARLLPFRNRGLQLAVDDAGAGHASFRHVLDLRPDTIKLDISLTRNINQDRGRQALAGALSIFGRAMGSQIVAEGVETVEELNTLRRVGVTKVQGYLTGRPMSLDDALSLAGLRKSQTALRA
ncbi:MAG TPA: EAL domain-containing protein [Hyphomonadaceae bacterium]|nr:EAL domain-containing protein [Hyphomonadaceae bacterium]